MPSRLCPHTEREMVDERHWRCLACKQSFVPRGMPIRHGTVEGYNKHKRVHKGRWPLLACERCVVANREWHQEYSARPEVAKLRRIRGSARMAALERVRKAYPAAFSAAYREELEKRDLREVRQHYEIPVWDDVLARLVKAATGRDEASVESRIRLRTASPEEAEVIRQVRRLRVILASKQSRSSET
jgi:hypothetical protein